MVSPLSSFLGAQERGLGIERQKLANQQAAQLAPMQLQSQQMNLSNAQLQRGVEEAQLLSNTIDAIQKIPDINQRYNTGVKAAQELKQIGINLPIDRMTPEDFTDERLMQHKAALTGFVQDPRAALKNLTSFQRDLDTSVQGLTGAINPATQKPFTPEEARQEILLREKGITARAGTTTGLERRSTDQQLGDQVADQVGREAGSKEYAKLTAQFDLKPKVAAAVTLAVENAKDAVVLQKEQRSNERALSVYDSAMANLTQSLGGTLTGPGAGWIPAMTANAQIAEGAMAAMAPVLKSIFRTAGEGTFTDKDQELLEKMIPNRNDLPEARAAKIAGIDAIVRAKLGTSQQATPAQQNQQNTPPTNQQGWRLMTDAQGNRAYVSPDGSQFEEVR